MTTWTIDQLHALVNMAHAQELEAVRLIAQHHVQTADQPLPLRLRWAKLALQANQLPPDDHAWSKGRKAQQDFTLRAWIIDHLDPDRSDPDWDPEALAADTLAALTIGPMDARQFADRWRNLPTEQIGELRRHKNLTAHLDMLIKHLPAGPIRERLLVWSDTRKHLP